MPPEPRQTKISRNLATVLVYGRPPLVFGGMLCAVGVMWNRDPLLYFLGVFLLFVAMSFDLIDGWYAARFGPHIKLAHLAERIMDKIVYSIIFPLVAIGMMWRLQFLQPAPSRGDLLHAILVMVLCITVLVRDNFAHFIIGFAQRTGLEPEMKGLTRLRTIVATPIGTLLYAYAFHIPDGIATRTYDWTSWLGDLPLRHLIFIEIIFLIINFGHIAAYCRRYGSYCLDALCFDNKRLRHRILSVFPNSLTVMNAVMGLIAVFFAYQGRIREAYLFLIGAALFDKLDGAVARRLGLTDNTPPGAVSMGSIMDDISDAISFCIVPAWIFYVVLSNAPDPLLQRLPVGWVAVAYGALGITRLVYFTLDRNPIPGFFKGLPSPAAALLVVSPLMMFDKAADMASIAMRPWGLFCFGTVIMAAVMMNIYFIHYLHFGRFMGRRPWFTRINALIVFATLFTPYFGHVTLLYMLIYLASPLVTWRVDPEIAARETRTA
jgi:CDP-diacylglycerol--serine O-phosphatidyltransferase